MKRAILDIIATTFIVVGTTIILFAVGGSDAGDFTLGRALVQVVYGLIIALAGVAGKALSRKEGN